MASLSVKDQGNGPIVYARWRDEDGRGVWAPIGRGWLVRDGQGGAKNNAKSIGKWREKKGNSPEGFYDVDEAREQVPTIVDAWKAQKALQEAQAKRESGEGIALRKAAQKFLDYGRAGDPNSDPPRAPWKWSYSKNMEHYLGRIVTALGEDRRLDSVTGDELKTVFKGFKPTRNGRETGQPANVKMLANYAHGARGLWAYAIEEGWIDADSNASDSLPSYRSPKKRSDDPLRRHEYLTPEEVRATLGKLDREQDRVMFLTMTMGGLRPGEAAALRWQDINHAASSLTIVEARTMGKTGTTKSGSGRTVPMAPEVAQALAALSLREHHTRPRDIIFRGERAEFVDMNTFRARVMKAQKDAGIDPPRALRYLRNTFGTVCASAGIPLRTIQQWMGHSSIQITERYASFLPREEDAKRLSEAFAVGPVAEAEKALVNDDDKKIQDA